jgi:hypothetical protein
VGLACWILRDVPTSRRLLAGAALGLLALTGCGSTQGGDAGPRATATVTATTTATATVTASSQSQSPTPSGSVSRCRTAHLRFRLLPGEGAAGSTYFTIRMTNAAADQPCRTRGFGGVSLVTAPHGQPIGAPADRTQAGTARPLVLQPGEHADATLREVNAENYPSAKCHPTPATGLRVYPPDETRSAYVAHTTTACAATAVHLLSLTPYATGH